VSARAAAIVLLVHAVVIAAALNPQWRKQPILSPDSPTYIVPARNLLEHRTFSGESAPPYLWEPYRTIGYPALIAATLLVVHDSRFVMFWAALTAALAAWAAVSLTACWGGGHRAQQIAGVTAAFLPNSLGLSSHILTDAIAGHLTVVWLFAVYLAITRPRILTVVVSVVLTAILQSLKPTFNVIAIIVLITALLIARTPRQWMYALVIGALSLPVPLISAEMNRRDHGIFSPSLLGIATIREYVQVRAIVEDTGEDYEQVTKEVRDRDLSDAKALQFPTSLAGRLYLVKQAKVQAFIRDEPLRVARLAATEMLRQLAAPHEILFQLFTNEVPGWMRGLTTLLTLSLWGAAVYGGLVLVRSGMWRPVMLTCAVTMFFLCTGAVSHFVGARLRFPADMAAIPLTAIGIARLCDARPQAPSREHK
jgi:hypothetical protein